jgi:hypothetical protein
MTATLSISSRVRVVKDVVSRNLDGESVLLNLATGTYFGLDPVGTEIWEALEKGASLPEIAAAITADFEVSSEQCESDLLELVRKLENEKLVEILS